MASSSSNVVGVHYRVGKKIGEGSFGVIFEGTNLLNNQQVAIKFVRDLRLSILVLGLYSDTDRNRNLARVMLPSCVMSTGRTRSWSDAVSVSRMREFAPISSMLTPACSRYPQCLLLRPGGSAQYPRD